MLHLMQVYKMIQDKTLFIELFNDLSYEINEMLDNHFGLYLEDSRQLQRLTETIIKKQGSLQFLKMM